LSEHAPERSHLLDRVHTSLGDPVFLQGKGLSDSEQRLRGSGNVVRNIRLEGGAKTMDDSYVRTLIGHALKRAKVGIPIGQKRQFIIKSVSAKQRPRRPAKEQGAHKH